MFRMLPDGVGNAVAGILGYAAFVLDFRDRALAEKHLGMAYGDTLDTKEKRRIVRSMFRNIALNVADIARLNAMKSEDLLAVFEPHGIHHLRDGLAKKRGILMLTAHTGNWEMLGAWLVAMGLPLAAIARRLYDPRLEDLLSGSRSGSGIRTITRGDNTREITRSLKEGYILAVLTDQDIPKLKGIFVEFFGIPAYTATSAALLSLKYGAPMIPVFNYRDENGRHHACAGEPLVVTPSGDLDADVAALTTLSVKATEDFIRAHPDQWVWFHKRWKTRPESEGTA